MPGMSSSDTAGTSGTARPTTVGSCRCPRPAACPPRSRSTRLPATHRAPSGWAGPPPWSIPTATSGSPRATDRSPHRARPTTTATQCSSCRRRSRWSSTSRRRPGRPTTPAISISRPAWRCSPTARSSPPPSSRSAFLLNGSSLGGIGGQQAQLDDACGTVIDGGLAVEGSIVYLPCLSGPVAVQTSDSPAGLHLLWSSSVGGGPPIVAGGLVWTIGSNGVLYGLNPTSGALQDQATIGAPANHFPTPSIGAGLLLAPSSNRVVAFRAASSVPVPARTTTTSTPSTTKPSTTAAAPAEQPGGTSPWVIVAAIVGGLAVLGVVTWFIRRRRGQSGLDALSERTAGSRGPCRRRPRPARWTR